MLHSILEKQYVQFRKRRRIDSTLTFIRRKRPFSPLVAEKLLLSLFLCEFFRFGKNQKGVHFDSFRNISNATNAVVKTIGWLYTGSASLFSEAVHSIADTCNQLILTFGLWQSIKKPNPEHP